MLPFQIRKLFRYVPQVSAIVASIAKRTPRIAFLLLLVSGASYSIYPQSLDITPASMSVLLPTRIVECETTSPRCGSLGKIAWVFNGLKGSGAFASGSQPLEILHFDSDSFVVRRKDASGFVAIYAATVNGNGFNGTMTYWPTPNDLPTTNIWSGQIEERGGPIPQELRSRQGPADHQLKRVVACEGLYCPDTEVFPVVWTFAQSKGISQSSDKNQSLDLLHFDRDLLIVRRNDSTGSSAIYFTLLNDDEIFGSVLNVSSTNEMTSTGVWFGVIEDPRAMSPEIDHDLRNLGKIPVNLVVCLPVTGCSTYWNLKGSEGTEWKQERNRRPYQLTVERQGPDKIVVRGTLLLAGDVMTSEFIGQPTQDRIEGTYNLRTTMKDFHGNIHNIDEPGRWSATPLATSCVRADGLKLNNQEDLDIGRNARALRLFPDAKTCFTMAAKNGDPVAQFDLAALNYQNAGSPETVDYAEMFYWLKKSAEQGLYQSQLNLADLYKDGLGTEKNPEQAKYWYERANANEMSPESVEARRPKSQQELIYNALRGAMQSELDSAGSSSPRSADFGCIMRDNTHEICPN